MSLIRNAKNACEEVAGRDKRMTLRVRRHECSVAISMTDNGVGVAAENLVRIFNHGFTTRKEGRSFGLHSGAL